MLALTANLSSYSSDESAHKQLESNMEVDDDANGKCFIVYSTLLLY